MNAHDETEIDNLPFEEYSQVMAERGAAEFGNLNKPKLSFKEIVASDMTFTQIEAEYGEETAINSGIARDPDTWDVDGRRLCARPAFFQGLCQDYGELYHANVSVTTDTYAHSLPGWQKQAAEVVCEGDGGIKIRHDVRQ